MFKTKILILIFSTLLAGGFLVWSKTKTVKTTVHYHAGFKVFVNGKQEDFGQLKYMELKPCLVDKKKKVVEDPQIAKAHLHDSDGDVVHVENGGAVWGDLFKNTHFDIQKQASVSAYLSGSKIENILAYPIKAYDSVIIVFGDSSQADISHYVTVDRIKEVEVKSGSCGDD